MGRRGRVEAFAGAVAGARALSSRFRDGVRAWAVVLAGVCGAIAACAQQQPFPAWAYPGSHMQVGHGAAAGTAGVKVNLYRGADA